MSFLQKWYRIFWNNKHGNCTSFLEQFIIISRKRTINGKPRFLCRSSANMTITQTLGKLAIIFFLSRREKDNICDILSEQWSTRINKWKIEIWTKHHPTTVYMDVYTNGKPVKFKFNLEHRFNSTFLIIRDFIAWISILPWYKFIGFSLQLESFANSQTHISCGNKLSHEKHMMSNWGEGNRHATLNGAWRP